MDNHVNDHANDHASKHNKNKKRDQNQARKDKYQYRVDIMSRDARQTG
jgi:hypothetical protein